jgi:hypothetical protein
LYGSQKIAVITVIAPLYGSQKIAVITVIALLYGSQKIAVTTVIAPLYGYVTYFHLQNTEAKTIPKASFASANPQHRINNKYLMTSRQ